MSTTRQVNGNTYHVACNWQPRPLKCWQELEHSVIAEHFGDDYPIDESYGEEWQERFFEYRGSWYDLCEIPLASDDLCAMGFSGALANSAWSAVVVSCFGEDGMPRDGEVVVGYVHW